MKQLRIKAMVFIILSFYFLFGWLEYQIQCLKKGMDVQQKEIIEVSDQFLDQVVEIKRWADKIYEWQWRVSDWHDKVQMEQAMGGGEGIK